MSNNDLTAVVESLTKPNELQKQKADWYGLVYGLTLVTWILTIVPYCWWLYHAAF
jgi:hypothetical protein